MYLLLALDGAIAHCSLRSTLVLYQLSKVVNELIPSEQFFPYRPPIHSG